MTKKHFIALADAIREHNKQFAYGDSRFNMAQLIALADFCQAQNPHFNRERWMGYIRGDNGPNGGQK